MRRLNPPLTGQHFPNKSVLRFFQSDWNRTGQMDFKEKELRDKAKTTLTNTPTCIARKKTGPLKHPILKESLVSKMRINFADFPYRQNTVNQR